MLIAVKNLADFETTITTCINNGENSIRVFLSKKEERMRGTSVGNMGEQGVEFIFILFTKLYQVIFTDTVKKSKYDEIEKSFLEFQDRNADKFRVQVFKSIEINYEKSLIAVEKELYVL